MKLSRKKISLVVLLVLAVAGVAVLAFHNVSREITVTDAEYIGLFTEGFDRADANADYERQIEFIKRVQDSVLTIAPEDKELPFRDEREPKDLYHAKHGLCFDRSRVIEKILNHNGYETRHIFLYSTKDSNVIQAFATPGVPSHAISEVLTAKGWLVIDSNERWISTDASGDPISMEQVQDFAAGQTPIVWSSPPPTIYTDIAPFTFVYGLYSRHGEFYPPYNFIPDVNYGELLYNFY